jgi:hypothetical protein
VELPSLVQPAAGISLLKNSAISTADAERPYRSDGSRPADASGVASQWAEGFTFVDRDLLALVILGPRRLFIDQGRAGSEDAQPIQCT